MKKPYITTIIVAIVVAAGAFFGGMTYQKSSDSLKGLTGQALTTKMQSLGLSTSGFGGDRNVNGAGGPPTGDFPGGTNGARRFGGGGFNSGQIVSLDSTSLTIKLADGSTKVIYYSSSTAISKTTTGSSSDLTVGTEVSATGTSNSDGSVTAQDIRINPNIPNANSNTNSAATQ